MPRAPKLSSFPAIRGALKFYQVASIITGAVRDVATAVGGFATDAFEIRDGMRTAARDNEPEPSDD